LGIIQKQSISGVIWSYVGVGLGFLTTAILFTRFLETEEIGLLRLLVSYASILAMFSSLGVTSVTIRMFPHFRNEKEKHHGFLGLALMVVIVGFLLSSIVYILLKNWLLEGAEEKSALFIPFFYAVIPLTFFNVLFGVLDAYFRVLYNAVKGIAYKEVFQRVFIIGIVFLYYFQIVGFSLFVWLYVLAYLTPVLFFVASVVKQKKVFLKPDLKFLSTPLRKEMASVAFFGILASFSGILVQSIDVIMIDRFLGLSAAGIYTIGFFFGTLILIPMRTMAKIGSVVIADAWKKNDLKTISEVYTKSSLTLSIVGLLFFVGIWGNIDNVFQLVGEEYSAGRYVILFIALANLTEVGMGMSSYIISNSTYYKWLTYLLVIFAGIIVITNFIFIPMYGIMGAALASFLSKLVFNLMKLAFIKIRFGLYPFTRKHLLLAAIAVAAWYISTFIPAFANYIIDIVIRNTALSILFLVPVYFFRISDDLNGRAEWVLKEVLRFTKKP
jgi:O-antigen/teichoic acid export membrane protein